MWLAGEKEISRVVLPKLMEMCLRQQVALLYRQEEEKKRLFTLRLSASVTALPRKVPAVAFPPVSYPHLETWGLCELAQKYCEVISTRIWECSTASKCEKTHRHSMETGRLLLPGTTAALTHTSRHPPRSHCTLTLQSESGP